MILQKVVCKKIYQAKNNYKTAKTVISTSCKIDFKTQKMLLEVKRTFYNDKRAHTSGDLVVINIYAPHNKAPNYIFFKTGRTKFR